MPLCSVALAVMFADRPAWRLELRHLHGDRDDRRAMVMALSLGLLGLHPVCTIAVVDPADSTHLWHAIRSAPGRSTTPKSDGGLADAVSSSLTSWRTHSAITVADHHWCLSLLGAPIGLAMIAGVDLLPVLMVKQDIGLAAEQLLQGL
jgi:hypothetical protein